MPVKVDPEIQEALEALDLTIWEARHPKVVSGVSEKTGKLIHRENKERVNVVLQGPGLPHDCLGFGSTLQAAVDDALAWWQALLAQGIDPANVVFGGDSAGGGLTLATLIAARDQGLPLPAGAFLFSPWTDLSCSGDTMRTQAKADAMFEPQALPQAAAFYLSGQPANTPLASPLFADLSGLPPLMFHASEHEILLDDSRRTHAKAQQQGVQSELHLKARMPHVWPTMVLLPEARESLKQTLAFVARVTGRSN